MTGKSVLDLLHENADSLTNKQKQLGSYIIANYQTAAFMNARDLAKNANVGESTVIRLVTKIGYDRFVDFQKALQEVMRKHISNLETLEKYEVSQGKKQMAYDDVFTLEQVIIAETLANIEPDIFNAAVELLYSRKYVIVLGSGGDDVVANYAEKYLRLFRDNILNFTSCDDIYLTQCINNCKRDNAVALVYSAPRYYNRALDITSSLRRRNIEVIGVTDNKLAPLAAMSDYLFITPMRYITMVDPLCSMMAMTHALLTGCANKNLDKARERIAEYYRYTKENNICIRDNIAINI